MQDDRVHIEPLEKCTFGIAVDRGEIEARARAEALVRDELARWDALRAQVEELKPRGWPQRIGAAVAGTRLVGLLAGDGLGRGRGRSEVERRGARLRRRRFRLTRRMRVLDRGRSPLPPVAPRGPLWLTEIGEEAVLAGGSALRQRLLADLLAGGGESCARPARVLIDPDCPPTVADNVDQIGLERASDVSDADLAIVKREDGGLGFDWILRGERSTASAGALGARLDQGADATALAEALVASARAPTFCIRIASRDWESAGQGGDAALARSLARALGERGHQALIQVDAEAGLPVAESLDVLLVLRGRQTGESHPGRLNLIWQISHPDETEAAELNRYDRVLVASTSQTEELQRSLESPVETLLQFTDPQVFRPTPGTAPSHDVVFVGNWRGEFRQVVWDALQAGHPPALYGRGWDLLAPEHAVAEYVPHDDLCHLYSSCKVLLCDHWEDMRRLGFVSNRVFDALACGAFVIADDNPAIGEELPGAVETYANSADLSAKLERYLAAPQQRQLIAEKGRALVLTHHTVERRVEQLLASAAVAARECERPELRHLRDRWTDGPGGDASAAGEAPKGAPAGGA